jgi:protein-L-isoaspartate(D-aspartate) O-methyltransferase
MYRTRDISGRVLDRHDGPAAAFSEPFHVLKYAPEGVRRGHYGEIYFLSAPARLDRLSCRSRGLKPLMSDMVQLRRWYAEDLKLRAPVRRNMAIIEAFAAVPRERFFEAGPWLLLSDIAPDLAVITPDTDVRWLYHDVLVTIDQTRCLNNGLPSLWARILDHLHLRRGQRLLQIGAGTGYYTAVLAELVGAEGRVIGVEYDGELAARARTNLSAWVQVDVVHGDGRTHDAGEVDAIIVFAGSTHPAPLWLDRLAPGGQLLMPLTAENRWGFVLLATRRREYEKDLIVLPDARDENRFNAMSLGRVGIFPCAGGRDPQSAERLQCVLLESLHCGYSYTDLPIEALHRGDPRPDIADKVWYHGPGFWLERRRPEP